MAQRGVRSLGERLTPRDFSSEKHGTLKQAVGDRARRDIAAPSAGLTVQTMWLEWIVSPQMLELIAKLLAIICLPAALAIVWQVRTRATWACLALAFGAIAVNAVAQIPLEPVIEFLFYRSVGNSFVKVWPYAVLLGTIYGVLGEGVRWLLFRFAVRTEWSWKEGVFFGICFSVLAALLALGNEIHMTISISKLWHPSQIIPHLNDRYFELKVLIGVWEWGFPRIAFDVGTSLAVLLSVRRRKAWPFLVAVLFSVLYGMPSTLVWPLKPVLERAGVDPVHSLALGFNFLRLLAVLPPLWFALHLRRAGAFPLTR